MTVAEFRKLVSSIDRAATAVRDCHLEELQDAVACALDDVRDAFDELEDVLPLEE